MFAMRFNKRSLGPLAAAMTLVVQCYSQVAAPASLPPCLIQYSFSSTIQITSRLLLYNSDQTYIEINSYYSSPIPVSGEPNPGTNPTSTGTFTYAVDPQNSAHATIVYDSGKGPLQNDELYFLTPNSGSNEFPPFQVEAFFGSAAFTLYPRQTTNGACNVSNLCQLVTAGTGTCGFVVQSGGPRWVLLRAIGASLRNFGVSVTVSSPSFTAYNSTQAILGTSSVWSADPNLVSGYETIFSLVGAFPLSSGSDEGVLLVPLNPGAYTAQFKAGSAGTILFEAYILPF
jgi:hypothetical protein